MQQSRQQTSGQGDPQSATVLREKRFALVLCGDDAIARGLVQRLALIDDGASGQNLSPSARQFFRFKKLFELWMSEVRHNSSDSQIFQPGRENEAIEKGLDPSIARAMGELPSMHRAVLLLIYGESFSYAATAQLLNISIEELMGALSDARHGFRATKQKGERAQSVSDATPPASAGIENEAVYDTAC